MKFCNTLRILVLIVFVIQSCNNDEMSVDVDYHCRTSYQIKNQTDKTIKVIRVYGKAIEDGKYRDLYETVYISSDERKEVFSSGEMCGENTTIHEFDGEILPILLNNLSVDVYAENQHINENILIKENWAFSAEKYYNATYILVITDELIESVGYNE